MSCEIYVTFSTPDLFLRNAKMLDELDTALGFVISCCGHNSSLLCQILKTEYKWSLRWYYSVSFGNLIQWNNLTNEQYFSLSSCMHGWSSICKDVESSFLPHIRSLLWSVVKEVRNKEIVFLQAIKRARSRFLKDTNYDPESNDARNILSRCRLKLPDFLQIIYQMVPDPWDFLFKCYFNNPCYCKMHSEPVKWRAW